MWEEFKALRKEYLVVLVIKLLFSQYSSIITSYQRPKECVVKSVRKEYKFLSYFLIGLAVNMSSIRKTSK